MGIAARRTQPPPGPALYSLHNGVLVYGPYPLGDEPICVRVVDPGRDASVCRVRNVPRDRHGIHGALFFVGLRKRGVRAR